MMPTDNTSSGVPVSGNSNSNNNAGVAGVPTLAGSSQMAPPQDMGGPMSNSLLMHRSMQNGMMAASQHGLASSAQTAMATVSNNCCMVGTGDGGSQNDLSAQGNMVAGRGLILGTTGSMQLNNDGVNGANNGASPATMTYMSSRKHSSTEDISLPTTQSPGIQGIMINTHGSYYSGMSNLAMAQGWGKSENPRMPQHDGSAMMSHMGAGWSGMMNNNSVSMLPSGQARMMSQDGTRPAQGSASAGMMTRASGGNQGNNSSAEMMQPGNTQMGGLASAGSNGLRMGQTPSPGPNQMGGLSNAGPNGMQMGQTPSPGPNQMGGLANSGPNGLQMGQTPSPGPNQMAGMANAGPNGMLMGHTPSPGPDQMGGLANAGPNGMQTGQTPSPGPNQMGWLANAGPNGMQTGQTLSPGPNQMHQPFQLDATMFKSAPSPCLNLESCSHGGGTSYPATGDETPENGTTDSKTSLVKRQQRWLLFLRHCAKCRLDETSCQLKMQCKFGKELWKHILVCNLAGGEACQYPRCNYSKELLKHHQKCTDAQCPICSPVAKARSAVAYKSLSNVLDTQQPTAPGSMITQPSQQGQASGFNSTTPPITRGGMMGAPNVEPQANRMANSMSYSNAGNAGWSGFNGVGPTQTSWESNMAAPNTTPGQLTASAGAAGMRGSMSNMGGQGIMNSLTSHVAGSNAVSTGNQMGVASQTMSGQMAGMMGGAHNMRNLNMISGTNTTAGEMRAPDSRSPSNTMGNGNMIGNSSNVIGNINSASHANVMGNANSMSNNSNMGNTNLMGNNSNMGSLLMNNSSKLGNANTMGTPNTMGNNNMIGNNRNMSGYNNSTMGYNANTMNMTNSSLMGSSIFTGNTGSMANANMMGSYTNMGSNANVNTMSNHMGMASNANSTCNMRAQLGGGSNGMAANMDSTYNGMGQLGGSYNLTSQAGGTASQARLMDTTESMVRNMNVQTGGTDSLAGQVGGSNSLAGQRGASNTMPGQMGGFNTTSSQMGASNSLAGQMGASNALPGQMGVSNSLAGQMGASNTMPGQMGGFNTTSSQMGAFNSLAGQVGASNAMPGQIGVSNSMAGQMGASKTMPGQMGGFNTTSNPMGESNSLADQMGGSNSLAGQIGASNSVAGQWGASNAMPGQMGASNSLAGQMGASNTIPGQMGGFNPQSSQMGRSNVAADQMTRHNTMSPSQVGDFNNMDSQIGASNAATDQMDRGSTICSKMSDFNTMNATFTPSNMTPNTAFQTVSGHACSDTKPETEINPQGQPRFTPSYSGEDQGPFILPPLPTRSGNTNKRGFFQMEDSKGFVSNSGAAEKSPASSQSEQTVRRIKSEAAVKQPLQVPEHKYACTSLLEVFTADQLKKHIQHMRTTPRMLPPKGTPVALNSHSDICGVCNQSKLHLEPPQLNCTCCGAKVKHGHVYYGTPGATNADKSTFCNACYNGQAGDKISVDDLSFKKSDLQKKKNTEMMEEGWVACEKCEGWVHMVCSLFNQGQTDNNNVQFECPKCLLEGLENGTRAPLQVRPRSMLEAKDLPVCQFSHHLEEHMSRAIEVEQAARARAQGVDVSELPPIDQLTIRVVNQMEKKHEVKSKMIEAFADVNYPTEFPYTQRVVLLFQKIDNVDICLFCMYLQEYGNDCPAPNKNCVYLSYLDSVNYFRPEVQCATSNISLRTYIYHHMLIGYLEYVKMLGFEKMLIWSCPPMQGDDYIMHCHPPDQRLPRSDRLRNWYLDMLKTARDGIVTRVSCLWDSFFDGGKDHRLEKCSAADIPYLEGDYWPGEAEKQLTLLANGVTPTKRASGKKRGRVGLEATTDQQLMAQLGEILGGPMKEDFLVVHLKEVCSFCCMHVEGGDTAFKYTAPHTTVKPAAGKKCPPAQPLTLTLCEACYSEESERSTYLGSKPRLPAGVTLDKLNPVKVDLIKQIQDSHPVVSHEIFETRQSFLSLCQMNNYQFDTLRRTKHSSMKVLYHLHNPQEPALIMHCDLCHTDMNPGTGFQCNQCPDFDICDTCNESAGHQHPLLSRAKEMKTEKVDYAESREQEGQAPNIMTALLHACNCSSSNCTSTSCKKLRQLFQHAMQCTVKVSNGCPMCKKMWYLLTLHAKGCTDNDCRVPRCKEQKEWKRRQQERQDEKRRLAYQNMLEHQASAVAPEVYPAASLQYRTLHAST
eukprot:gene2381-8689_t